MLRAPNGRRYGWSFAVPLLSAALISTQTWQIVETSAGLRLAAATAQAQTPAAAAAVAPAAASPVGYDAVYGGVAATTTADDIALTITRDGDGYNPVTVAYSGAQSGALAFQYAPGDARTVESDGDTATHLVYSGDYLPMAEFDTGADATSRYHFPGRGQLSDGSQGGSGQLAGSADGSELFAITDRLGSTRTLLSAGAVQARFDYDTLGKPTETDKCSSACPAREYAWRYQSHRYILIADADEAAAYRADKAAGLQAGAGYQPGLQDFKARFYDHGQGRFLNTDLAHVSISPYTGMGNDWVNRVDPDGRSDEQILRFIARFMSNDDDRIITKTDVYGLLLILLYFAIVVGHYCGELCSSEVNDLLGAPQIGGNGGRPGDGGDDNLARAPSEVELVVRPDRGGAGGNDIWEDEDSLSGSDVPLLQLVRPNRRGTQVEEDEEKTDVEDEEKELISAQSSSRPRRGTPPPHSEAALARPTELHRRYFYDYLDLAREIRADLVANLGWNRSTVTDAVAERLSQLIPDTLVGRQGDPLTHRRPLLRDALIGAIDAPHFAGVNIPELPPLRTLRSRSPNDGTITVENLNPLDDHIAPVRFGPAVQRGARQQSIRVRQNDDLHARESAE